MTEINDYNTGNLKAPSTGPDLVQGRIVVAFGEQTRLWWLAGLKPGFRHCFAYLESPSGWLAVDPQSHRLFLEVHPCPPETDLAAALRRAGWPALTIRPSAPPATAAPLAFFTCVEVVKRLIGIKSAEIKTPWQLFRALRKIALDFGYVSFYTCNQQEQNTIYYRIKSAIRFLHALPVRFPRVRGRAGASTRR